MSRTSLNYHNAQPFAWLRIVTAANSMPWSVPTQCNATRDAFIFQFLIAVRGPLSRVPSSLRSALVCQSKPEKNQQCFFLKDDNLISALHRSFTSFCSGKVLHHEKGNGFDQKILHIFFWGCVRSHTQWHVSLHGYEVSS